MVFALIGVYGATVGSLRRGAPIKPVFAASISLIFGTWLFHSLLPHELFERYMLPAIPAAVILAASGIQSFSKTLTLQRWAVTMALAWIAIIAFQTQGARRAPISEDSAFPAVAQFLAIQAANNENDTILVSGERNGEGLLIAELASRERRLHSWMLRASKVLSRSGWHGENYKVRFTRDNEILNYLDRVPVEFLVLNSSPRYDHDLHQKQLLSAIAAHPERFKLLLRTTASDSCRGDYCYVDVYRYVAPNSANAVQVGLGAKQMIGRELFSDWRIGSEVSP